MMWKFFLLAGLLPLVASFIARKFFCDRILHRYNGEKVTLTGKEFAEAVLKCGEVTGVEVVQKRRPFLPIKPNRLILSPRVADSTLAVDVAEAGLRASLTLMARRQEKVVAWRVWAVKFASSLPIFTLMVIAFALILSRFSGGWALGIESFTLGLGCVALWLTFTVEREAAKLVAGFLDEKAVVTRRTEAELLEKMVKAIAWRRILPSFFG